MEYSQPYGKPYKLHRQWHLGELLDQLANRNLLTWHGRFQISSVEWTITETGRPTKVLGTKAAEAIAQRLANAERIVWIPVGGKGGKETWQLVAERIEHIEAGHEPRPWDADFDQSGG